MVLGEKIKNLYRQYIYVQVLKERLSAIASTAYDEYISISEHQRRIRNIERTLRI